MHSKRVMCMCKMEEAAPQGSVQYSEAAAGSYVCIISDGAESP
jgi:hypothetical protein